MVNLAMITAFAVAIKAILAVLILIQLTVKPNCEKIINFKNEKRIIGGHQVKCNKYPSMAASATKRSKGFPEELMMCGCLITSFHCSLNLVLEHGPLSQAEISGDGTQWKKGVYHQVAHYTKHKDFDDSSLNNQISLIEVEEPFIDHFEKPTPLFSLGYKHKTNKTVGVLGWGVTDLNSDNYENTLKKVDLLLLTEEYCEHACKDFKFANQLPCVEDDDACTFDSGEPTFYRKVLIGVLSWGYECSSRFTRGCRSFTIGYFLEDKNK